jgi:hypothetical protein
VIAVGVAAVLALGACGGNDDNDASGSNSDTTAVQPTNEPGLANAATFCNAILDADGAGSFGEDATGDEPALAAAEKAAPEAIRADVTTMAKEARAQVATGMTGGPSSHKYFTARTAVGDYIADNCGYQVIDVTATDYAFDGIPANAKAAKTLIRLTNNGTEYHEVALQFIHSGETRSIKNILALPEEVSGDLLDYIDHAFAPPGLSNWTVIDLSAGRVAALCYVPTGATPEALRSGQIKKGAPSHVMKGMFAEMQVS